MRPNLFAFMRGANSRQTRNAVVRLAAITSCQVASSTSSRGNACLGSSRFGAIGPPATLIRKSGVPTLAESRSTSSASVRSATSTSVTGWISVAKTCTASRLSLSTIEAPIPLAAPVTSALRPFNPSSGIGRAVGVDRDPGHVGRVVGAERHDQRRALCHGAYSAHGDGGERTLRAMFYFCYFKNALEAAAGDDSRRNAVHAHAERAELEGELAREAHHAGFRHCIGTARALAAGRNAFA